MTVKELKEKLREFPDGAEVCLCYARNSFVLEEVFFDEDVNAVILDT